MVDKVQACSEEKAVYTFLTLARGNVLLGPTQWDSDGSTLRHSRFNARHYHSNEVSQNNTRAADYEFVIIIRGK
jgi:hypothetical protein